MVGEPWRTIDGRGAGRGSCGRDRVGGGPCINKGVGGESNSGWAMVGGERNKKSFGISESPSIV